MENPSETKEETKGNLSTPPDLSKQRIDYCQLLFTTMLLCGPFLLGMIISQLSNAASLKITYTNSAKFPISNSSIDNVWSLGGFFPIGGMFGALAAANLVQSMGRKKSTITFFVIMLIGNIFGLVSLYISFALLVISRFLSGFASAALMVSALCWMFERLPRRLEVIYQPLVQLIINVGIIMSSVLNLDIILDNCDYTLFLVVILFSILAIVTGLMTDESVKWKMLKSYDADTISSDMKALRGAGFIEEELQFMKSEVAKEMAQSKMTLKDFITSRRLRPAVICAIFLHMAQQLSGINAIVSFCQIIIGNVPNVNLYVVGILVLNAFFSLFFCLIVSKFPRKAMLLFGHSLMAIGYMIFIITMYSFSAPPIGLNIFSLCLVLFAFQSAPGPMVWFITFEIFPSNAVGVAQGVCSSTNWLANSMIFFIFPLLETRMAMENILMIFLVINVFVVIFIWFFIVETKNRTVDDILSEYARRFRMD